MVLAVNASSVAQPLAELLLTSSNVVSTNIAPFKCRTFVKKERTAKQCKSDGGKHVGHPLAHLDAGTKDPSETTKNATNAANWHAGMTINLSVIPASDVLFVNQDGDHTHGEN